MTALTPVQVKTTVDAYVDAYVEGVKKNPTALAKWQKFIPDFRQSVYVELRRNLSDWSWNFLRYNSRDGFLDNPYGEHSHIKFEHSEGVTYETIRDFELIKKFRQLLTSTMDDETAEKREIMVEHIKGKLPPMPLDKLLGERAPDCVPQEVKDFLAQFDPPKNC